MTSPFSRCRTDSHGNYKHQMLHEAYNRNMRKTLRFKPAIVDRVNHIYDEVAKKMHLPRNKIYFVGVHNRRTDHIEWTKRKHKQNPLKADYFINGMEMFR